MCSYDTHTGKQYFYLLRPDCYFQIKDGVLKSLADSTKRELREGHNLEKMLRQGKFDE